MMLVKIHVQTPQQRAYPTNRKESGVLNLNLISSSCVLSHSPPTPTFFIKFKYLHTILSLETKKVWERKRTLSIEILIVFGLWRQVDDVLRELEQRH